MPKKILLIDSDDGFMRSVQAEAQSHGFLAVAASNSDMGLSLARREKPDLLVVCVEAQPTNGYMLCTRLKKDDVLKSVPIILTSASATEESFEKHRQLKTRADEYLLKPIDPSLLLEKASEVLGLGAASDVVDEEEIVSMEEEPMGMGDLLTDEDEAISLTDDEAAQARSGLEGDDELVVEEEEQVAEHAAGGDDDLQMFDKAFDALGVQGDEAPAAGGRARPPPARPAARPPPPPARTPPPKPAPAMDELSLEDDDLALADALAFDGEAAPAPRAPAAGGGLAARVEQLEQELGERDRQMQELESAKGAAEAAARAAQQRAEALAAAAKKFERELAQAREELKSSGGGRARLGELEKRIEELETESSALIGEKDLLASEREELRQRVADAEENAARNEERAVRAYQKIKTDERLREKTRKALQVALQLLEESAAEPASEDNPEQQSA